MAPTYPFSKYAHIYSGAPVTFIVGPNQVQLDIHNTLLASVSPLFVDPLNELPKTPSSPIILASVTPQDLFQLVNWLYERQPPVFTTAAGLPILMHLWVVASKLSVWRTQNAILRIAMALMQPADFEVDIETVLQVYTETSPGSKLRGFIIALFCQRARVQKHFFTARYEGLGIFKDAIAFLKVLNKVRLDGPLDMTGRKAPRARIEDTLMYKPRGSVAGGNEQKVRLPLLPYLVWGEGGEDLPDMFFVTPDESARDAVEVAGQV